jgi:hypothetical protein
VAKEARHLQFCTVLPHTQAFSFLFRCGVRLSVILLGPLGFPLGPMGITVPQAGQSSPFLSILDASFTLAPQAFVVPNQVGSFGYQHGVHGVPTCGRCFRHRSVRRYHLLEGFCYSRS